MDFAITLDSEAAVPLHRQLYEALRQAILNGRLLPRQRLPSTRSLAKSLGLSRTTVTQSYEQLLSEGYLETIVGSGTFVCAQLPDDLLHSAPVESADRASRPPIQLSKYGFWLGEIDTSLQRELETGISFHYGRPAFDQFPLQLWRKLLSRHCCASIDWLDYSADPLGEMPLREAIARYLSRARAVKCEPNQVLITNGTQQALDLIMRLLLDPGDVLAMEDPGYLSARRIFLSHGATLLPVPVDESGLVVNALSNRSDHSIKLVYVTPSHQFPTGATLSLPRRLELLAWAQQTGALILEDDYDSEYRYGDRPIPALQGLDQSHSVLYIGTFSKVLFPSLRIGYLVLPPSLVTWFSRAKWLNDRHLPILEQRVLAEFIEAGHLESHIRKMRSVYDRRRQTLVSALKAHFGDRITILGEKAGIHVMIRLHTNLSDSEMIERAAQVKVGLMSARPHYFQANSLQASSLQVNGLQANDFQANSLQANDLHASYSGEFIFGYGELTEPQIQAGIDRLAQALNA